MLVIRILPLPLSLISLDEVSFIPGREGSDNKAFKLHHWLTSQAHQGFFLSLDAEKALKKG